MPVVNYGCLPPNQSLLTIWVPSQISRPTSRSNTCKASSLHYVLSTILLSMTVLAVWRGMRKIGRKPEHCRCHEDASGLNNST